MRYFPHYTQQQTMDCGPTCLKMIAKYYGKSVNINRLRDNSYITKNGVSMLGICDAAESIGFQSTGVCISTDQLTNEVQLPCVVHWKRDHFIVVYKVCERRGDVWIYVADPAAGKMKLKVCEFENGWTAHESKGEKRGHCLILEPTERFFASQNDITGYADLRKLFFYIRTFKPLLFHLILGFGLTSIFSLLIPILAKTVVDVGIEGKSKPILLIILLAQLFLTLGIASIGFVRGWIMLNLTNRINISLITSFLTSLMKLPLSFFESKRTGDLMQRINDNSRVQSFLTSTLVNVVFSFINILVLSGMIARYNLNIFLAFLFGSLMYILWIRLFLKYRRELDYRRFSQLSNNQSTLIQLITGMQDIKLYNSENQKKRQWEKVQINLFKISNRSLILSQYQGSGAVLINGVKNLIVSFLAAQAVVDGQMSLGTMVSIQYILGQLTGPLDSMVDFIQSCQDAKISMERLGEIQHLLPENSGDIVINKIPELGDISIEDLTFRYNGPRSPAVLQDINVVIQAYKVTAIVGSSGSGKTTLLKTLIGMHQATQGRIKIGSTPLEHIHTESWRDTIGTVMQEGFIFSDTIVANIALGQEIVDWIRLTHAVKIANIEEFISSLPSGYETLIGNEGSGLSQGQKQRLLIARAVYKNPKYLFFDEATNALDARNEKLIIENLSQFFEGRTVVVVAHRLSTVKNADQIIVMERGRIVEVGNHRQLVNNRSYYYDLVSNQLEIAS